MRRAFSLLGLAAVLVLAGCSGDDEQAAPSTTAATTTSTTTGGSCRAAKLPKSKPAGGFSAPRGHLDGLKSYKVVVSTNCGSFTITLDQQQPTRAVVSFVQLVRKDFYDNTIFHRIVPKFVIQGGDPTQSGTGGPGYSTVDSPPANVRYTKGVVAMAKTQDEPSGSAGSQFFVVTAENADLSPDYAVIGKVTRGLDVVERIGSRATKEDEHGDPLPPEKPVVIEDMRLVTS